MAKIIFPKKVADRNWQAECILGLFKHYKSDLEFTLKKDGLGPLVITPFDNGRERGFTATLGANVVSFAEHRSSDSIVLYPFPWDVPEAKKELDYQTLTVYKKHQEFYQSFTIILEKLGARL